MVSLHLSLFPFIIISVEAAGGGFFIFILSPFIIIISAEGGTLYFSLLSPGARSRKMGWNLSQLNWQK